MIHADSHKVIGDETAWKKKCEEKENRNKHITLWLVVHFVKSKMKHSMQRKIEEKRVKRDASIGNFSSHFLILFTLADDDEKVLPNTMPSTTFQLIDFNCWHETVLHFSLNKSVSFFDNFQWNRRWWRIINIFHDFVSVQSNWCPKRMTKRQKCEIKSKRRTKEKNALTTQAQKYSH